MGILKILKTNPILTQFISIPFCIIILILLLKFILNILNKLSPKNRKIFLCISNTILMIITFIEFILLNIESHIIISLICLLVFIYMLINESLYIKDFNELKNSYAKIQLLELDNKTLNTKYDELSAFHHDFNNIIQTIGGLLSIEKYDNLKRYYRGLKIDCQTLNDMEIFNNTKINNPEILSLLINKYELAKQNGIRMNLEIYSDLSKLSTDIFQIVRILGILLDNAIEASKECDEKILNIEFKFEENMQTIIIENSYINREINTDTLFKKGFSTKAGNTGLGLWKVNKILKHHKNLQLYTSKNSELFTQKLNISI